MAGRTGLCYFWLLDLYKMVVGCLAWSGAIWYCCLLFVLKTSLVTFDVKNLDARQGV